jgi:RNA polymerase sigma-70 factor (ECF subfamily)
VELVDRIRERFLVRQFQRGNADAFMALVQRSEKRLLYFLRRFERDRERALDVLQEVWLAAWKGRGTLRSPDAFRPWLYRIAHGKIISAIRAETRRRETEGASRLARPTTESRAPAAVGAAELVHFALARLSPEHREVMTLRFLEQMTIEEIAEAIDCNPGTVNSRLHYARQEMLSAIEEQTDGRL